jgi:hypothetical protein
MKIQPKHITFFMFYVILFLSCSGDRDSKKIIYEISTTDQMKIEEKIKAFKLDKVIVNIEIKDEIIDLCFQEANNERLNELYNKSNRYLKISDKTFIPVIFLQDFALTKSNNILSESGCIFRYQIEM